MLNEKREYFIHLNSISIPIPLTCEVAGNKDSFNFDYIINTEIPTDDDSDWKIRKTLKEGEQLWSNSHSQAPGPLSQKPGLSLGGVVDCLPILHDTISRSAHLGGVSGISASGLRYFTRQLFLSKTSIGKLIKVRIPTITRGEETDTVLRLRMRKATNTYRLSFGGELGYLLGLKDSEANSVIISKTDNEVGNILTAGLPLGSERRLVERRSHIYLECSVCEGCLVDGARRKILKVIPVQSFNCDGRYLTYEPPTPEFVKIEGDNIRDIRFSLTDADGKIIEAPKECPPTLVSCSILEE